MCLGIKRRAQFCLSFKCGKSEIKKCCHWWQWQMQTDRLHILKESFRQAQTHTHTQNSISNRNQNYFTRYSVMQSNYSYNSNHDYFPLSFGISFFFIHFLAFRTFMKAIMFSYWCFLTEFHSIGIRMKVNCTILWMK